MKVDRIGRFVVERELARGGMGVVYAGREPGGKPVAIKLLLKGRGATRAQQTRFQREIEAMSRLRHPHLVTIQETGDHTGCPYLVMELIAGETLQDRITRGGAIGGQEALALTGKLARALVHAHAQGVLHRDVKPANVLLNARGDPFLTDFGLAKALGETPAGTVVSLDGGAMGTPGYWPPEQASGELEKIGPRSDVYALGATLYAMLTGVPPYQADTLQALFAAMRNPVRPPSSVEAGVDPALESVCLRCLQREPDDRYPSMQALADALDAVAAGPSTGRGPRVQLLIPAAILSLGVCVAAWVVSSTGPSRTDRIGATSPPGSLAGPPTPGATASRADPDPAEEAKQPEGYDAWLARITVEQPQLAELYRAAVKKAVESEFAEAEGLLTKAIELDPGQALLWMDRGTSRTFLERYEQAVADYNHAFALDPGISEIVYLRGNAYFRWGQAEEALVDLTRALDTMPPGHAYVDPVVGLLRQVERAGGFTQTTAALVRRAGRALAQRDVVRALALVDKALDLVPGHLDALELRIRIHQALRRYPQALSDIAAVLEVAPEHVQAMTSRAQIRYELGQGAQAVLDFTRVLGWAGDEVALLVQRGRAHAVGGDRVAARIDFRRAMELGRQLQPALWLVGLGGDPEILAEFAPREEWQAVIARHYLGRLSEAELLSAAEAGGSERRGRLCETHCHLALIAEQREQPQVAVEHYRFVLEHAVAGFVEVPWARLRLAQLDPH